MRKRSLLTPLLAAGTLMMPTAAWAQAPAEGEAAAAPPAAAPAAEAPAPAPTETAQAEEAAPAEAPPPPPPPPAEAAPAPAEAAPAPEAPAAEAPAEEEGGVPGWFRFDSDLLTLQLWAGASHDVGGINIATDIYVTSGQFGEFDIGVELPLGESVLLIPMVGIGFDWGQLKPVSLVAPQLFAYFTFDPVYIEWWSQFFLNTVFAEPGFEEVDDGMGGTTFVEIKEGVPNTWYNRLFVTFSVTENLALGPQIEPLIALNDAAKTGDGAIASMPLGPVASVGYGENNTMLFFLGYELIKEARIEHTELDANGMPGDTHEHGLVGRMSFVHLW